MIAEQSHAQKFKTKQSEINEKKEFNVSQRKKIYNTRYTTTLRYHINKTVKQKAWLVALAISGLLSFAATPARVSDRKLSAVTYL